MFSHLPVANPHPDIQSFISILAGKVRKSATPLVEYIVDDAVMKPIVTNMLGRRWADWGDSRETQRAYLDNAIEFWRRLGYDFIRFERGLPFPVKQTLAPDTAPVLARPRVWLQERDGRIASWEDFERYPWPKIEEMDFFPFEYIAANLPEGMGFLTSHAGGIFEHLSWMMSLEGLCLSLIENPNLVAAVARRIGELMLEFYNHLLDLEGLAAVFAGDDMGFRTGTLISPNDLRSYFLPWHERIAAVVHRRGLPYFLHSCGRIEAVMPDLLDTVRIDGKHSFEDAILPVEAFHEKYGKRIAVLGGLDVHILASASPERVRQKTRALIETCGQRGRYAVGSGNSIPSYVPAANYLAMVDEALALR